MDILLTWMVRGVRCFDKPEWRTSVGKQYPRWMDGVEVLWLVTSRDRLSCREDGVLSSQLVWQTVPFVLSMANTGMCGDMRRTWQALSVFDLYHSSMAVWCDYNTVQFSSRHSEFPPGALMSPGIYRPTLCEPLMRWKCEDAKRDGVQGAEGFQPSHRFHIKPYNTSLWIA